MSGAVLLAAGLGAVHLALWATLAANVAWLRGERRRSAPVAPDTRVSVLVPARNEAANLERLLPSLARQTGLRLEVVVVDDASEDATWAVLTRHAEAWADGPHRLVPLRGDGPPPGWLGKNHALYQATRHATGDVFLFLDADAELRDAEAAARLVGRWQAGGPGTALSGLPALGGGGLLLVSLVPFAVLATLPLGLVPRTRTPSLSALNGQCWLAAAADYRRLEPHAALRAAVLEDVEIGRLAKRAGLRLWFGDLGGEVRVAMYASLGAARQGFRKNVYPLQGGTPLRFLAAEGFYLAVFVLGGLVWWPLFASAWALKAAVDRWAGMPAWVPALAPLSLALGALQALDSAAAHAAGRATWKGRRV